MRPFPVTPSDPLRRAVGAGDRSRARQSLTLRSVATGERRGEDRRAAIEKTATTSPASATARTFPTGRSRRSTRRERTASGDTAPAARE